jgi:signal transduction histidine kinase
MLSQIAGTTENNSDILQKISNNAKETVEKMSDIIWMINPKYDQLDNIKQRMEKNLYQMCSPKNIRYEFQVDYKHDLKLTMLQRKNLLMIFKEAVNNAVKYSDAKTITANVSQSDKHLELIISDDGKGFDMNNIQAGNGLDNMKIRTEELKGQISIRSQINTGTQINVSIQV